MSLQRGRVSARRDSMGGVRHSPRIDLLADLVAQSKLSQLSGHIVLHEHICFGYKLLDERQSLRALKVDSDAALASVGLEEVATLGWELAPVVDAQLRLTCFRCRRGSWRELDQRCARRVPAEPKRSASRRGGRNTFHIPCSSVVSSCRMLNLPDLSRKWGVSSAPYSVEGSNDSHLHPNPPASSSHKAQPIRGSNLAL